MYRKTETSCNNTGTTTVTGIPNQTLDGYSDRGSENSEPLLVATNTTLAYDASVDNNLTYDTENQPLAVGTNLTIDITYAEAALLEQQLGISLDGSDNYLGSNITVIDGDRDWLERIDGNPAYGAANDSYSWDLEGSENGESATEFDLSSEMNEPLLVGTNITFVIKEDTDGNSDMSGNENSYQRDEQTPFALGTNMLLELPGEGQQGNYLGNNLSTIEGDSETQTSAMEGGNPFSSGMGMMPAEMTPTSNDNSDYVWDFGGQDRFSTDSSGGMGGNLDPDALFAASPWGGLAETGAVDGFEDVFPNAVGEMQNNPFAGGFGGGD